MNQYAIKPPLIWLCGICALLPWAWVQARSSINGDTAWLLIAAERWLSGQDMAGSFYETNPPLSILIHVPPVWLAGLSGLPVYAVTYAIIFLLIGLSAWAVHTILRGWEFLSDHERIVITLSFLTGATILTSVSFGEREHFIFMALVPFTFIQLSMTWKIHQPAVLKWMILILGALLVLLKPHFGLIPVAFIGHRMIAQKRFWIIRDTDFVILALMTLGYIGLIWFAFPDFIHIILPDILGLYVHLKDPVIALPILLRYAIAYSVLLALAFAFVKPEDRQKHTLMLALFAGAILCLIPYGVQMKGFYYHLIPALGFMVMAVCYAGYLKAEPYFEKDKHTDLLFVSVIAILALAFTLRPLIPEYPTHEDYKNLPLAKVIEEECDKPCSVFIFHNSIEMANQTILYTGAEHAARFPSYWFLPPLHKKLQTGEPGAKELKDKFSAYIAEDMKLYQPSLLILLSNETLGDDDTPFSYVSFFSDHKAFKQEIKNYRKTATLEVNQRDYMRGTLRDKDKILTYDIYKRR